ncbi:disease resistance protein RGA5-like [Hordeum vulgare subsp. vulgare]|uniref:Uncharacterized protein n=1 Tax=Hordeum vulgare subsp. vulgare TaxID=112509 RepID=A0A8I6Y652_HORVV|nr:disease resistance protein RGA5-like [Hordeum vulgare subsp. vulgare]
MTEIMVGTFTGVMRSILSKLAFLTGEKLYLLINLRKEVKFITDELGSMNDLLEGLADVEELDPQTKGWRNQVRDMAYDIEDIIDDYIHYIGEKCESDGFVTKTARWLRTLRDGHKIVGRIKEIKTAVQESSLRRTRYNLHECITRSSSVSIDQRIFALYANAADLVGLDRPVNELVHWLIDDQKQLKSVSIVGFGGLGKTTLVNEVYRRMKGEFRGSAFVAVSQKPDIPKLLYSLLSQLGGQILFHACDLHDLVNKLRKHLHKKRYFIVIDDLWDVSVWDIIKCAFPENNLGSRVITTTRIQDVAKACSFNHRECILNMKPLSDEDSRTLFFSRIFGSEAGCPHQLKNVSVEILRKCGGLPLAVISVASLLASEDCNRMERWEHVQSSLGSMSGTNLTLERMRQILNLSYTNLPPHLKTCLMYIGMYPEDYTMQRTALEHQWIAEGFVNKAHGQDVHKVAMSYFNELVNRSLVQPVDFEFDKSVKSFKVHDIMLDLILCKSAEENFITVVDDIQAVAGLNQKTRRLSFCLDGAILPKKISMSQVRSLAIFRNTQNIPPVAQFKFLRVLVADFSSVYSYGGTIDLSGLCKLYHLRYLKIEGCDACQLPKEIRKLQNLETLDLDSKCCIPSDIVHLPCLLHLTVPAGARLPDGINKMTSLRSLRDIHLENNSIDCIKGVGELTNLSTLYLTWSDSMVDTATRMDVLCSSLEKLCSLRCLHLDATDCIDGLSTLSPPPHLEELRMNSCWFSRVPTWMGKLHNLSELKLRIDELQQDSLCILAELPSLIDLYLKIRRAPVEMIIICESAFPVLRRFLLCCSRVSSMSFQAKAMPKLQRLILQIEAQGSELHGAAPAGIEHLSALEEISALISLYDASYKDTISAEFALRNVASMHLNRPLTEVKFR